MMSNERVRKAIREAGVKQWEVALALGIHENTLIRMLRVPLTEEKEARIMEAIKTISERR